MINETVTMVWHQAHRHNYKGTIDTEMLPMTLFSEQSYVVM